MRDSTSLLRERLLLTLGASLWWAGCEPTTPAKGPDDFPPPPPTEIATSSEPPEKPPAETRASSSATPPPPPPPEMVLGLPGEESCPPRPTPPPDPRHYRAAYCADRGYQCEPALATTPSTHYPAPFDRCATKPGGMGGMLSVVETNRARKQNAGVCCYHQIERHPAGRPLQVAGAARQAALVSSQRWA